MANALVSNEAFSGKASAKGANASKSKLVSARTCRFESCARRFMNLRFHMCINRLNLLQRIWVTFLLLNVNLVYIMLEKIDIAQEVY